MFDWIIIDTPPVGLLPDANLLAAMLDGAVFVVAAGRTPCAVVQKAVEALGRDRILGVVLNRVDDSRRDARQLLLPLLRVDAEEALLVLPALVIA